jgi:hypothetical protein
MPFMEKQVYQGDGWIAETDNGCVVIYDWNAPDVEALSARIGEKVWIGDHFGTLEGVSYVRGYFGRMSAPGYLDCTPWEYSASRAELERLLSDLYGDEEESEDLDEEEV